MEDSLPALRVVAAEIETPGQSPRGDILSPSSSGDSFGKALMHQAMRLKTAMLNQKVLLMIRPDQLDMLAHCQVSCWVFILLSTNAVQ